MNFSMKSKVAAAAAALTMIAGASLASTVDLDQQVSGNTFGVPNWSQTVTRVIGSNPIAGGNSGTTRLSAGLFRLTDGTNNIEAFCLEPGITIDLDEDFDTMVATSLNSDQLAAVQKLYDSSYRDVTDAATAAAFQMVLWEIAAETVTDGSGSPMFDLTVGNNKFTSASTEALAAGADFLANLAGGPVAQRFALTTYTNSGQDLVSATPVPLPASSLLLLAGMGGLLAMRRRKAANA